MLDALEEGKSLRRTTKSALLALFGHCDTDTSFYLPPPSQVSRLVMLVLATDEQAQQLAVRLLNGKATSIQVYGQVLFVRKDEIEEVDEVIRRGTKAGAIQLRQRGEFDPRGGQLDNWTDDEIRSYISQMNLAKSTSGLTRDLMITMIRDDYFGVIGSGATTEDPNAKTPARLRKIFKKLDESPALRGQATASRELKASLREHVDDGFSHGRKRRISEMKKLVGMVKLPEKTVEGMTNALVEMGRL